MKNSRPYVVRELAELRTLASPARLELVTALGALQPCTVAELAEHLGRLPVSLYYHLRKLEQVGLVLEVDRQATEGPDEARYKLRRNCIRLDPDCSKEANRATLTKIRAAILRHALRLSEDAEPEESGRSREAGRHSLMQRTVRLDGDGLQQLNDKLAELTELLDTLSEHEPAATDEFFTLTLHVVPDSSRSPQMGN